MCAVEKKKLFDILNSHQEELLHDIRRLIAIESLNGRKAENDDALDFVLMRAAEMGMRTGATRKHDAGFAEIGQGAQTIGIFTHVDVVSVGDRTRWPFPPFAATVSDDGYIHGRGIVDDKGPLLMCLYAMKAIAEAGVTLKRKIRLIVGTTEESQWTDMAHYLAQFGAPDFSFSPDGDFPVFYSEKGHCNVRLLFGERGRLDEIVEACAGESHNSIPSSAVFELRGKPKKTYSGVAFHSSEPQNGDNALLKLAADARDEGFGFGRFLCDMFTNQFAEKLHLDDGTDTYQGTFVDRTVASPTILRRREDGVWLNVNVRVRYGVDEQWIRDSLARYAAEYGYTIDEIYRISSPMMVDWRLPFLQTMNAVYESHGYTGGFEVAAGASYSSMIPHCVCWGPILPGEPSCAHMEDEKLHLESMMQVTEIYLDYLSTMASSDEPAL